MADAVTSLDFIDCYRPNYSLMLSKTRITIVHQRYPLDCAIKKPQKVLRYQQLIILQTFHRCNVYNLSQSAFGKRVLYTTVLNIHTITFTQHSGGISNILQVDGCLNLFDPRDKHYKVDTFIVQHFRFMRYLLNDKDNPLLDLFILRIHINSTRVNLQEGTSGRPKC